MTEDFLTYLGGRKEIEKYKTNSSLGHLRKFLPKDETIEEKSYNRIKSIDEDFLKSLNKRILDKKDSNNSHSALGELRAYAKLLEFDYTIKSNGTKKGCDFTLSDENNKILIEVYTPQLSSKSKTPHKDCTTICPYGRPEPGKKRDSVTANMISRICSACNKGDQASNPDNIPAILYIDFYDVDLVGSSIDHCQPVSSFRDEIYSGGCWLAFYGKKETKIFDGSAVHDKHCVKMEHDGRFARKKIDRFCGSLLSFPPSGSCGNLVFFENPRRLAPDHFKRHLVNSSDMNWEFSCWKYGNEFDLKKYIELQNKKSEMLYDQLYSGNN